MPKMHTRTCSCACTMQTTCIFSTRAIEANVGRELCMPWLQCAWTKTGQRIMQFTFWLRQVFQRSDSQVFLPHCRSACFQYTSQNQNNFSYPTPQSINDCCTVQCQIINVFEKMTSLSLEIGFCFLVKITQQRDNEYFFQILKHKNFLTF